MSSGSLRETSVAERLSALADQGATGCLRMERQGQSARIWLRGGAVYTASAPEARPRLGDRLVGAGHITGSDLEHTLRDQRQMPERRRIGELLIERGVIDRDTMQAYVREQITDSVAATLGWSDGAWQFLAGEETVEDVPLEASVENLLMEGARRLEQWEVIRARLGSMDTIVDFVPGGVQAELALTPDEWSMLTRIDGHATIGEIAANSGYGQLETARIVYGLFTAGVVRIVEGETVDAHVDRGELLREFAELTGRSDSEEPASDAEPPSGGEPPPRQRDAPRREPLPPPEPEPKEQREQPRRGFLGRFRRG